MVRYIRLFIFVLLTVLLASTVAALPAEVNEVITLYNANIESVPGYVKGAIGNGDVLMEIRMADGTDWHLIGMVEKGIISDVQVREGAVPEEKTIYVTETAVQHVVNSEDPWKTLGLYWGGDIRVEHAGFGEIIMGGVVSSILFFKNLGGKPRVSFSDAGSALVAGAPGENARVVSSTRWHEPFLPFTWEVDEGWVNERINELVHANAGSALVSFHYLSQDGTRRVVKVMGAQSGGKYFAPVPNMRGQHTLCMELATTLGEQKKVHAVLPIGKITFGTSATYDTNDPGAC